MSGGGKKGDRIDYVTLSLNIDAKHGSARVLPDINLRNIGEDHHPTMLVCKSNSGVG